MSAILRQIVLWICITVAGLLGSVCYADGPDSFVRSLSASLLQELAANQGNLKDNDDLAYSIAEKIIMPSIDVEGMARSVLGRKVWTTMTAKQRQDFTQSFARLIIKTYARSLTDYDDDKIKVLPMNKRYAGKTRVVVKSQLIRDSGQKIALKYRMIAKKGHWKIYDVSVEGISLLQNFRTQFSSALARDSIDSLIAKIKP